MKLKGLYNIWKHLFNLKVKFKEIKKDMEIKDNKLTINIPLGMEIDLQNSNFDAGVIKFKKKDITIQNVHGYILSIFLIQGL